jgi:protein-S-isoprenylcysteine O-methyltransferase Ste14
MNLIAIVLGILATLIVILTGILPVIGAIFAWIALIIAVVGLVFGLLSNRTNGRNICILACILAGLRLALGFGFV